MALKTGDSQWSNDGPLVQVDVAWGFLPIWLFLH